jgi:hypothetical protein
LTLNTSDAARLGLLVHCAQDMFDSDPVNPVADARIANAGWDVVAHVRGGEPEFVPNAPLALKVGEVFIGFLARNVADPNRYAVAIRGTGDFMEWAIDADFPSVDFDAAVPGARVEKGFMDLYATLKLYDLGGSAVGADMVDGILQIAPAGPIVVTGHSLGAAIATYLSLALATAAPGRVQAALFDSPRTGNKAFADHFAAMVADYTLYNYGLDVVPRVPFTLPPPLDYVTLPNAIVFGPHQSEADVHVDIGCNHYILDYIAMLDYPYAQSLAVDDTLSDAATRSHCILGLRSWGLNEGFAEMLEFLVDQLDGQTAVKAFAKRFPREPLV